MGRIDDLAYDQEHNRLFAALGTRRHLAAFQVPAGAFYVRFKFASDDLVSSPLYQGVWVDDVLVQG